MFVGMVVELDIPVERVRFTGQNVNARYALFSTGGFTDDLVEYAETQGDIKLVGLEEIVHDRPPRTPGTP